MRTKKHLLWFFTFTILNAAPLSSVFAQTEPPPEKPIILITGFDPFGGATENHSFQVAQQLKPLLAQHYDVYPCLVPTRYDQDFLAAQQCLLALPRKPDLIISLGEGASCGQVNLEQATWNEDSDSLADNAGVTRVRHTIIPNEPSKKKIRFYSQQIKSWLRTIPEIKLTHSIGNYVCNNLAFHWVTYLENYSAPPIPFAFMHVQTHDCGDDLTTAPAIASLIEKLPR